MTNNTIINNIEYATNDNGTGLFYWGRKAGQISNEWIQIKGNCDFSVKGLKNPKAKIRREVRKDF